MLFRLLRFRFFFCSISSVSSPKSGLSFNRVFFFLRIRSVCRSFRSFFFLGGFPGVARRYSVGQGGGPDAASAGEPRPPDGRSRWAAGLGDEEREAHGETRCFVLCCFFIDLYSRPRDQHSDLFLWLFFCTCLTSFFACFFCFFFCVFRLFLSCSFFWSAFPLFLRLALLRRMCRYVRRLFCWQLQQ